MKCDVCKRPLVQRQTVHRAYDNSLRVLACSEECQQQYDEKRPQKDAFPADLWTPLIYSVTEVECQGVKIGNIKVTENKEGQFVVQAQVDHPAGISVDELMVLKSGTCSVSYRRSTLTEISAPKTDDDGDVDSASEMPLSDVFDDGETAELLADAGFSEIGEVCELGSAEALAEKTQFNDDDAKQIYDECWRVFDEAREAIRFDGLGLDEKIVDDLHAAGFYSAQQVLSVKAKDLREQTKLPQSRISNVRSICNAAIEGAKAAAANNNNEDGKGKDGKAA